MGGVGGGRLFVFDWEGEGGGVGWALIRGWALINFFSLWDGRLIEVGANSRLGAYSNKYGTPWAGIETLDLVKDHLGTLKW